MKIKDVIAKLEAHHKPLDPSRPTCDGVITGDTEQECTGIAVTCCPTAAVIGKAAQQGCNLLVCHEPTFFDGFDKTDWLTENSVYLEKKALIERTHMVIFRNHDRLHSDRPDGIFTGVTKLLGWEPYLKTETYMPGCVFQFPETTVRNVARQLAETMNIGGMRFIGDPEMKVTRAGFTLHFFGTDMDRTCIDFIEKNDIQVIIPGETVDWTIGEYVQDAIALGKKRALLTPGHMNWEEPGMKYVAGWIPQVIGTEVPVTFIQSGSGFDWLSFRL